MRLLLASKSMTRRRMLEAAGVAFDLCDTPLDEEIAKAELRARHYSAIDLASGLAAAKALSVAADPGDLIIGADQTLERNDGSTLDKPQSIDDAFEQLRSLSGTAHRLHSAAVVTQEGAICWRHTESVTLYVRNLSEVFIRDYLADEYEAIRFNVGGYRIEGPGVQLFDRIDGSHFAILGLPLLALLGYLRTLGLMKS